MRKISSLASAVRSAQWRRIVVGPLVCTLALALTGCVVARGGPEPLDGDVVGTLASVSTDPISLAAHRALVLEQDEWRDEASGAWGTVRRVGPDDARACTPAELTVHDYRGARVEERTLCPPPVAAMVP